METIIMKTIIIMETIIMKTIIMKTIIMETIIMEIGIIIRIIIKEITVGGNFSFMIDQTTINKLIGFKIIINNLL